MTKEEKIKNFDPNDIGNTNNNIFGLPFTTDEADIVILPFPWEVTVSYNSGTANGPQAIYDASYQVDIYDPIAKDAWKVGIAMEEVSKEWLKKSNDLRKKAKAYIDKLSAGASENDEKFKDVLAEVNAASTEFSEWVRKKALQHLNKNKMVVGLGGDHSTPLGLINALSEIYNSFAILQLDAHADLRIAYEGFEYSHASIMYNALKNPAVSKLVQVGIRDYSEGEVQIIESSDGRIKTFFDRDIKQELYRGVSHKDLFMRVVENLPENIYLSFDIDALDPKLCPHTGTPVAGGFEFEEALYLIELVVESGKKIIGFDLNEVAPGEDDWDANVGARLLFRICNLMAKSQGKFEVL